MDVLVALACRAPAPMTRDDLLNRVWGHTAVTDGVLTRCVSLLRHHLGGDRASPRYIETLSKGGYRLAAVIAFPAHPPPPSAVRNGPTEPVAVAVLPFVSLSSDPVDDHLADALTDLVIASLGGAPGLAVNSRTSSMCFKHSHMRLRTIAGKLHASHVIEGSLLRISRQMQIVVQLIDSERDAHRWSHTYLRETCNLLVQMNDVARSITHATCVTLSVADAPGCTSDAPFASGTSPTMCATCLVRPGLLQ